MKTPHQVNPDELLAALGQLLADDAERRPRRELEELTRGELDSRALAELERQSRQDPALQQALEAHRPLGPAVQDRISQRLLSREPAGRPKVASWVRHGVWVAPLALAASLLLLVWSRGSELEELGAYRAEVNFAAATTRSGASAPEALRVLHVTQDQRLEVLLRPSVAERGAVEAAAFIREGAQLGPLDVTPARGSSGALLLGLSVPRFVPPATLVVVVARPGIDKAGVAREPALLGHGWQRFEFDLELLPAVSD
jgi:hypothetical protein